MPLQRFHTISNVLRFDFHGKRLGLFGPIKELWDSWVDLLAKAYTLGENVTIGKQSLWYEGDSPFNSVGQHRLQFSTIYDSTSGYVWNIKPDLIEAYARDLTQGLSGKKINNHFHSKEASETLMRIGKKYTSMRRSTKWTSVVFSKMLDISSINAYIVFKEIKQWNLHGKEDSHRTFIENLGKQLIKKFRNDQTIMRKHNIQRDGEKQAVEDFKALEALFGLSIEPATKKFKRQGRCYLCDKMANVTKCEDCQKFVCNDHKEQICKPCYYK